MTSLSEWKRRLQKIGFPEQPRAERQNAVGLAAEYGLESTFTSAGIKDISASGIYLITEKRLGTGELITLVLHEEGKPANSSELQFSIHARVARQGEDGIGLSFDLPPGLDTDLWGVLVRNIVTLSKPAQIAKMFRTLRVILFLCNLCQSEAEEAILLLGGQLHDERAATLVKIALAAEKMLSSEPDFERLRAHPKLVANILREGSWTSDERVIQLWAGLLVSSCSVDASDNSNQVFVELLIHIAPGLASIFIYACEHVLNAAQGAEIAASSPVVVSPDDLLALTGVTELARNASSVANLFNLGLIQQLPDFSTYSPLEEFDITPTSMGLEFYQRCHGKRGKVDLELVETVEKHLRDLLTRPPDWTSE